MPSKGALAAAFHEVKHNTPKIVKHTAAKFGAGDAKRQAVAIALSKARKADASGANYVSRNDLHINPKVDPGWKRGSSMVPHKGVPGLSGEDQVTTGMVGDITKQVGGPEGPGPSYCGEGIVTVAMVDRKLNPVEAARKKNNATRDARTNLGRGKVGEVVAEEENNVRKDW